MARRRGVDAEYRVTTEGADKAEKEVGGIASAFDDLGNSIPGPAGEIADVVGDLSGGDLAAGAAAIGAVGLALADMGRDALAAAESAQKIAIALETDVESASRLGAAFEDAAIEADEMIDIALTTVDALEAEADLAAKIGVNLAEGVSPAEQLEAAVAAWDLLTPTERMKLFGEEGNRQIAGLIERFGSLEAAQEQVSDARVINDEDVRQADELRRTISELADLWDSISLTIGQKVVTAVNDVKSVVDAVTDSVTYWADLLTDLNIATPDEIDAIKRAFRSAVDPVYATKRAWDDLNGTMKVSGQIAADIVPQEERLRLEQIALEEAAAAAAVENEALAQAFRDQAEAAVAAAEADLALAEQQLANVEAGREAVDQTYALQKAIIELNASQTERDDQLAAGNLTAAERNLLLIGSVEGAIAAGNAFSEMAEAEAAASGAAFEASDALAAYNEGLLQTASTAGPEAQAAIVGYIAELNKIPPDKVSDIVASIDEIGLSGATAALNEASEEREALLAAEAEVEQAAADLDEAAEDRDTIITATSNAEQVAADLDTAARNRTSYIDVIERRVSAPSTSPTSPTAVPGSTEGARPSGASMTNVTVNLPAASQGRDVVTSLERWARINGG